VFSAATAVKTAAGVLLGTPHYMSPEACESKGDVDHRTDIYALGVLLFQMMTGALPFNGESMGEVLVKQVTTLPPAPRGINPAIPPSVEQILLRCLAKPVDARFATMHQLRDALLDPEAYLRGSPPIAPARSVGPGEALVDARAVMAHAAQQPQRTRISAPYPSQAATRLAMSAPLPLPAPARSLPGSAAEQTMIAGLSPGVSAPGKRVSAGMPALAASQEPAMNTMRIATPLGYSSRAPRKVWPVVLIAAVLLGAGGGAVAVWFGRGSSTMGDGSASDDGSGADSAGAQAMAETRAGNRGADGADGADGAAAHAPSTGEGRPASSGSVGAASPGSAGSASQGSASTAGSAVASSPPPAGSAGTAGAAPGSATSGEATDTPGAGASAAAGRTQGSGSSRARETPSPASTAHLSIDSAPTGASVIGPDGAALGKTPLKLEWPISDLPVTFELRLAGYRRKLKPTVVNGNTALRVELDRVPVVRHTAGSGSPKRGPGPGSGSAKSRGRDNGLMRPDD
jgi:serine/threonine-protein kinase